MEKEFENHPGTDAAVTEERVTKKVIRRRPGGAPAPTALQEASGTTEQAAVPSSPSVGEVSAPAAETEASPAQIEAAAPEPAPTAAPRSKARSLKKVAPSEPVVSTDHIRIPEPPPAATVSPQETPSAPEGSSTSPTAPSAEVTSPESETSSYQGGRYRRIKIVSQPSETEMFAANNPIVRMPDPSSQKPSSPVLGRKEVVEVGHFSKQNKNLRGKQKKRGMGGDMGRGFHRAQKTEITTPKAAKRVVRISEGIVVAELAKRMSLKVGEVISRLLSMGMVVTLNQTIDADTAAIVANEFGYEIENVTLAPEDILAEAENEQENKAEDLEERPPVVTVMGHVDHGKTTLLDRIRKADVASGEAGGITQHIGAYTVKTETGRYVTFVDTPGHEAFTAMRARGAKVTDIVILVVAADDGVMPQTKEAISHAKSAGVKIIVAVNKIDKPGANVEKIKKELTEFEMVPEEWGGDTIYVPVSAKTGEGVAQLLEFVLLQSEVLDLKANPKRLAKGVVIESSLDKHRGVLCTVLVQDGTLKEGDILVAGTQMGRVRAMRDDKGARIREAGPSRAVEVMGLSGVCTAGDKFSVVADEKKAKQVTEMRMNQIRQTELSKSTKVSLDDLYQKIEDGDVKELRVLLKADTAGSVEVLTKALHELSTPKVSVKVIHGAVGGVSENDVMLASASSAIVVAFHVRPDAAIRKLAEQHGVEVRTYTIIYEITEDMTKAMTGLLKPQQVEKVVGQLEVRQTFSVPKLGLIAGCFVLQGKVQRSSKVRLLRDSVEVYSGTLKSLKRFKDDVREVVEGMECGLGIENFNDIKAGDRIEVFQIDEIAASLT